MNSIIRNILRKNKYQFSFKTLENIFWINLASLYYETYVMNTCRKVLQNAFIGVYNFISGYLIIKRSKINLILIY